MTCRYEHFLTDWYARQCAALQIDGTVDERSISFRKIWEWAAIIQALEERDMLEPDRSGMGFAVGQEPLASIFASRGVGVLASDMPGGDTYWSNTGQHAASLDALYLPGHLSRADFDRLVSFQPVDMNDISALQSESADFIWSSCAIEHVGSLELAKRFVLDSTRLLKPGGVAVHTTEYNCTSNTETIEVGDNVIFRRQDIEALEERLRAICCGMERPDFDPGVHSFDLLYDEEPYFTTGKKHIKLKIGNFVSTSFLLIVRKG